jgi:transcriptional regulator with XRE-family HTH domain
MTMTKKEIRFDPGMVEAEENLLVDYQFLLQERMSKKGLSQGALAERAGISDARLSQIMSDNANPTVKTFAALFYALGERVCVSSRSLDQPHEPPLAQEPPQVPEWQWATPVRIGKAIGPEMIELMKSSTKVIDEQSAASNDNYGSGPRITYVDPEVAAALALEPEAEAA